MLRPYQTKALDAMHYAYLDGIRRQLVVMPTGTGKTVVFCNLCHWGYRVLILVHTDELVNQAVDKLIKYDASLRISVEKAERKADPSSDVIVASVQTLVRKKRRERFDWSTFDICIVDEAHHAAAERYQTILKDTGFLDDGESCKQLVGFTATPNRADKRGLMPTFQQVVFEYTIDQAIADKCLCDLKAARAVSGTNLDAVKCRGGDFADGELSEAINTSYRNGIIVKHWRNKAADRKTLIFCADIKHAKTLAAAFVDSGIDARATYGADPDRKQTLTAHKAGEFPVLCNCQLLTEGYDDPEIRCVVLARPTRSQSFYIQMIGRGTRILPDKKDCLILDISDNTTRHELVTMAQLFADGDEDLDIGDDETVTQARQRNAAAKKEKDRAKLIEIELLKRKQQQQQQQSKPKEELCTPKQRGWWHYNVGEWPRKGVTKKQMSKMIAAEQLKIQKADERQKHEFSRN